MVHVFSRGPRRPGLVTQNWSTLARLGQKMSNNWDLVGPHKYIVIFWPCEVLQGLWLYRTPGGMVPHVPAYEQTGQNSYTFWAIFAKNDQKSGPMDRALLIMWNNDLWDLITLTLYIYIRNIFYVLRGQGPDKLKISHVKGVNFQTWGQKDT